MNYIAEGIQKGLIKFDDKQDYLSFVTKKLKLTFHLLQKIEINLSFVTEN